MALLRPEPLHRGTADTFLNRVKKLPCQITRWETRLGVERDAGQGHVNFAVEWLSFGGLGLCGLCVSCRERLCGAQASGAHVETQNGSGSAGAKLLAAEGSSRQCVKRKPLAITATGSTVLLCNCPGPSAP